MLYRVLSNHFVGWKPSITTPRLFVYRRKYSSTTTTSSSSTSIPRHHYLGPITVPVVVVVLVAVGGGYNKNNKDDTTTTHMLSWCHPSRTSTRSTMGPKTNDDDDDVVSSSVMVEYNDHQIPHPHTLHHHQNHNPPPPSDESTQPHQQQQQQQHSSSTSSSRRHTWQLVLLPTIQSFQRIGRLVGTGMIIILDYKCIPIYERIHSFQKQMTTTTTNDSSVTQEYLEQEIVRWQAELDHAQMIYATPTPLQQQQLSLEERVRVKQQEQQQMIQAAQRLTQAQDALSQNLIHVANHPMDTDGNDPTTTNTTNATTTTTPPTTTLSIKSQVHARSAQRLLQLCQTNRGVYIKIGQHLANLDYIVPSEYITTLSALYHQNPISSYESDVCTVFQEEFNGQLPTDLFHTFDPVPIASASLAQVHVATDIHGHKYAVKVQHRGLRETSRGDIISLNMAVQWIEWVFTKQEFSFRWLAEEMAPNLPKELNFRHEGQNAERAASFLLTTTTIPPWSWIIPKVHWDTTSERILTMDFEEGCHITDIDRLHEMGFTSHKDLSDITKLVSSIFAAQVFVSGFVHCDPHPANVLVRPDTRTGAPVIVLLDHGLYKEIDTDFRLKYAQLWKSILLANVNDIMQACYDLGMPKSTTTDSNIGIGDTPPSNRRSSMSDDACRLFAGVITARPFDEVIERSNQKKRSIWSWLWNPQPRSTLSSQKNDTKSDQAIIRGYAQRFLPNIVALLSILPRQVLLLLKMNDCLRHIDYTLGGSPTNTMMVNGHYAAYALYQNELQQASLTTTSSILVSWRRPFQAWWAYMKITTRIHINEMIVWWIQRLESIVHL